MLLTAWGIIVANWLNVNSFWLENSPEWLRGSAVHVSVVGAAPRSCSYAYMLEFPPQNFQSLKALGKAGMDVYHPRGLSCVG